MAAAGAAHRRPRIGTVASALLVLTLGSGMLAGCGGGDENPYGLSEFQSGTSGTSAGSAGEPGSGVAGSGPGGTSSTAATPSAGVPQITVSKPPPGLVAYTPSDPFAEGAWVEIGAITGASGARRAVADAVVAYLSARAQMSNTWVVDNQALASVASGQALTSAVKRAQAQRSAKQRSVGRFVLNLSSITVTGNSALVAGCPFDATVEVSTQGSVMSDATGGVELTMNLERSGGRWRAVSFPIETTICKEPAR